MPKIRISDDAVYQVKLNQIMFTLLADDKVTTFNADEIYHEARKINLPPQFLARAVQGLFKTFTASGYLKKLNTFRISNRNSSSPLPLYAKRKLKPVEDA